MTSPLLSRLASLRKKNAVENQSPRSSAANSSPLSLFLHIYSKAERECYIDYNEGTKALLEWLAPAGIPLDYEVDKYPEIENQQFRVPKLLQGYASGEVTKLLAGSQESYSTVSFWCEAVARADRAVYLTMTRSVVYELY